MPLSKRYLRLIGWIFLRLAAMIISTRKKPRKKRKKAISMAGIKNTEVIYFTSITITENDATDRNTDTFPSTEWFIFMIQDIASNQHCKTQLKISC